MLRRVFLVTSALSLILCIGTAAMWIRSRYAHDDHVFRHALLYSSEGGVGFESWPENSGIRAVPFVTGGRTTHAVVWQSGSTVAPTVIQARYSQLFLLFVCLPIASLLMLAHSYRSRQQTGTCKYCEYDLTGNVSGVCPECGKEISREVRS